MATEQQQGMDKLIEALTASVVAQAEACAKLGDFGETWFDDSQEQLWISRHYESLSEEKIEQDEEGLGLRRRAKDLALLFAAAVALDDDEDAAADNIAGLARDLKEALCKLEECDD